MTSPRFLLDTNVVIGLLKGIEQAAELLRQSGADVLSTDLQRRLGCRDVAAATAHPALCAVEQHIDGGRRVEGEDLRHQ